MAWLQISDPEVVNQWEKDIDRETRLRSVLLDDTYGLAGEDRSSLIQIETDLNKEPGSFIRFKMKYQLKGRGKAGDEVLKGQAEQYETSTFNVYVNTLRHAVEVESPIQQQWVTEDVLDESKDGLADWFATRLVLSLHLHATGVSFVTDEAYRVHNTINALNSEYVVTPGDKALDDLVSTDVFTIDVLNTAIATIKTLRPRIRPARTPLGEKYVCILHPDQVHSLRESDSQWFAVMTAALKGGSIDDNPIFTNALGMAHDVIFLEDDFIPPGLNTAGTTMMDNTRRAWIGGAGALKLAFGAGWAPPGYALNRFQWATEADDFNHRKQVAATTIAGIARPRYTRPSEGTAREAGALAIQTYAKRRASAAHAYEMWTDIDGVTVA